MKTTIEWFNFIKSLIGQTILFILVIPYGICIILTGILDIIGKQIEKYLVN